MSSERESWQLYWDGEKWGVGGETAQLRLRGSESETVIYRRAEGGPGWERLSVSERDELRAAQRGWVWEVWPQRIGSAELVGFRGAIALSADQRAAGALVEGLTPLDQESGRALGSPAPGRVFLLNASEAEVFSERVRSAGGGITRAGSWMGDISGEISRVSETAELIERALGEDLQTLSEAAEGDLSGEIEFDQRGVWIREQASVSRARARDAAERLRISRQNSTQRAEALLAQRELRAAAARIEELLAARERAERILTLEIAKREKGSKKEAGVSEISLKLLLRDLAALWGSEGVELAEGESELIVGLDGERLGVGRKLRRVGPLGPMAQKRADAELDPDWPDGEDL